MNFEDEPRFPLILVPDHTAPCRHCGECCGDPDSPDFLSVMGCGGMGVPV